MSVSSVYYILFERSFPMQRRNVFDTRGFVSMNAIPFAEVVWFEHGNAMIARNKVPSVEQLILLIDPAILKDIPKGQLQICKSLLAGAARDILNSYLLPVDDAASDSLESAQSLGSSTIMPGDTVSQSGSLIEKAIRAPVARAHRAKEIGLVVLFLILGWYANYVYGRIT